MLVYMSLPKEFNHFPGSKHLFILHLLLSKQLGQKKKKKKNYNFQVYGQFYKVLMVDNETCKSIAKVTAC
jgi:hypothetical protein